MLCSEIIAVCCEIRTKHINTLCGQNIGFFNVKPGGTKNNHWDLNGQVASDEKFNGRFSPITGIKETYN
jgi:hypothetical protein